MTRKLAAYAAGLLACSSFTVPAFAQDTEMPEMPEAPEADDSVIIVTATRRAQDVQDIPLAVTAVSPQQLDNQGVDSIQEVVSVATSFTASNAQVASGSVVLRIRGIGTTSNNIGFESAVGIFIDGTYQSRPGVALTELVDVERVEVLRGPQGTTFGRNTSAGALNITNKRPDLNEVGGFVNAGYGNFDEISLQGAVNVPIVEDALALRVTGAYRERDGFITLVDETGTPFDDSNDTDQWLVRAQLGFETEGGVRGRIIGDYSKSNSSCCSPIELYQSPLVTGGAYAAVGLGANGGNGQPTVATTPFDNATFREALNDRVASANFAPIVDIDNWGITGEVEFPVGDDADLIFIGGYRKFASNETYDSDFTALDIFNVDLLDLELETITAELRLQGEAFEGKLNYIIGGFYSDEQIDQSVSFSLGSDYDANVGALLFVPTGGALGAAPLQTLSGGVNPAGTTNTNRFQQSAQSYSIFTHNTFEVFDGFELTLGARYSWEEKEGGFTQTTVNNQICPAILGAFGAGFIPAGLEGPAVQLGCFGFTAPADLPQATQPGLPAAFLPRTFQADFSDEELIYTIRAAYEISPEVNAYGSFTHGYKAGGINLDTTAAVAGADPTFLSEEVDAFEIGLKTRFLDNGLKTRFLDNAVTFNLAAFYEEFQNFQVLEFTGTAFQTFNVPLAETKGLEIESVIRPSRELTLNAAATILEASYPEDCAGDQTAPQVVSLCGYDLTNAPQVIALFGALWEKPISDSAEFFLSGQVRIESDQRTSTQAIVPPSFPPGSNPTQAQVQAAAAAQPLIIADVQDGNEFINLRAGLRFNDGAYSIEGFVNNLTDNVARGVTFNTTLRGSGAANSRSAFPLQPRTYGVVLRAKF
ncbi:TonB-dependent receptor [Erythrobacter litoralis]|uniref:TonB-dependent receptor n=1 Tax=Erythrobacter litoralis TaxID=39960 RepID=A0A074MUQ6_9SPHN|nr:TonB-dependent receptor [Erythrobacter litoralis]KEO89352.1 TonB-dependent receptor [Erythrobacter litoralis]